MMVLKLSELKISSTSPHSQEECDRRTICLIAQTCKQAGNLELQGIDTKSQQNYQVAHAICKEMLCSLEEQGRRSGEIG